MQGKDAQFPTPFGDGFGSAIAEPYTLIELRLLGALGEIKSKPYWWDKIMNETIRERWKKELVEGFISYLNEPVPWRYEGAEDDVGKATVAASWTNAVLKELQETAESQVLRIGDAVYSPGPVEGTWMSDSAIPSTMRKRLAKLVEPLEHPVDYFTGHPIARDYHPSSNQQVIDLVHPSLYPYVYGFSREVAQPEETLSIFSWKKDIGTGEPRLNRIPKNNKRHVTTFHSTQFQWLPSEVDVVRDDLNGSYKATFRSYINNLHPDQHTALYHELEGIFALFVPMFERVLVDMLNPKVRRHHVAPNEIHEENPHDFFKEREAYWDWETSGKGDVCTITTELLFEWVERWWREARAKARPDDVAFHRSQAAVECDKVPSEESESATSFDEKEKELEGAEDECSQSPEDKERRVIASADMATLVAPNKVAESSSSSFSSDLEDSEADNDRKDEESNDEPCTEFEVGNRRLQVIVKLSTIELTPEKPSYDGGAWHVEGMENESIVASGIYYWHSENVGGSDSVTRLAFRTTVCQPNYKQNDESGVEAAYGLGDQKALIQPLGSIPTIEGRAIVWPNTLQHQVQPFRLMDPTKPGFRKILVFFLVDPTKRVVSTADVPPQQEEWYLRQLLTNFNERQSAGQPTEKAARTESKESKPRKGSAAPLFGDRDILEQITSFAWPYSHQKALTVRKGLMDERKYFTDHTMKETYERLFSLCEH